MVYHWSGIAHGVAVVNQAITGLPVFPKQLYQYIQSNMSKFVPSVLLSLILTSFCYGQGNVADEITADIGSNIRIVTTIKPLQLIAQAIVEGEGSVVTLLPNHQSPHHYALTPSDRLTLAEADLLVWVGPALESFLISVMENLSQSKQLITAMALPDLVVHDYGASQIDPHFWLDPGNALILAETIRDVVSEIDGPNAARYTQNLERFRQQIAQLDSVSRSMLMAIQAQPYAVYHNAYQYLESYFDFQHDLALVEDPEVPPGMRAMLATREALARLQPVCLFTDEETNESVVNTLLAGQEIQRSVLDPLGYTVAVDGVDSNGYVSLIENLLLTMSACFE